MKYWIYMAGEVPGQYAPDELVKLPGFTPKALVCPAEGESSERRWKPAEAFPNIAQYLNAGPAAPEAAEPAAQAPQAAQPTAEPPSKAIGPEDVLDQTNTKLFKHISQLMRELEDHRLDKKSAQEARENMAKVQKENKGLSERVEQLNRVLSEKELALAKALAALARAEQELGKMILPEEKVAGKVLAQPELRPMAPIEAEPAAPEPPIEPMQAPAPNGGLADFAKPAEPAQPPPPQIPPPWKEALDDAVASLRKLLKPRPR